MGVPPGIAVKIPCHLSTSLGLWKRDAGNIAKLYQNFLSIKLAVWRILFCLLNHSLGDFIGPIGDDLKPERVSTENVWGLS